MTIQHSLINDLFFQAINFEKKGNLLKAKSIYKKIIKINPKFPNAYYNLGNILNALGEYEKAIHCYEKVIKIDPQNISAFNNLGVLYKNAEISTAQEYLKNNNYQIDAINIFSNSITLTINASELSKLSTISQSKPINFS